MIAGLSGSLLSHDALEAGETPSPDAPLAGVAAARAERALRQWHARLLRSGGPAWGARKVFDEVAAPLFSILGFQALPCSADQSAVHAVLQTNGTTGAVLTAIGWGQEPAAAWRESVRRGIGAGVRWSLCVNGLVLRMFDAHRTHSRRYAQLELARIAEDAVTFRLAWRLLRAEALVTQALDAAVHLSERHRLDVREALQCGVHEALGHLTAAFVNAGRGRQRQVPTTTQAFDDSLVVVYRILFLLFAEARGLVPTWHPVFREGYTIEALRASVETFQQPPGVWEALQAIARLAHRGCRAGSLRVPPFNGRLFSPAHAPLADSLPLDDRAVRDALLALTTRAGRTGRQRIAYADLGVEHLGGVYERVLDFEVTVPPAGKGPAAFARSERRKTTGTFYTPRPLTEYLVRRTLAPLVQGRSPDQILRLRILDPAMGSGAFLVAACRYLADAYEGALLRDGVISALDPTERDRAGFRRAVAQRCLYGVDVNPMAVQLGRLSLWLATLSGDRPLTFFDHHLRAGNSLVGATIHDVTRATSGAMNRRSPLPLFESDSLHRDLGDAVASHLSLRDGSEETLEQMRRKEKLFALLMSRDGPLARWKRIADLWCAGWFDEGLRANRGVFHALLDAAATPVTAAERLLASADQVARRERFFHWTLEFPEIFSPAPGDSPGFDAIVGNPPWDMVRGDWGGRLIRFTRGSGIYRSQGGGQGNLYQMFVERTLGLLRAGGRLGLVLPSGIGSDHGCASLRQRLLDTTTVDSFVSIENRDALFPIHRGVKFVLLTATAAGSTQTLPYRAGLRAAAEFDGLPEVGSDPAEVPVPRTLLEKMSGPQLAIPDFRTRRDAALAARLTFAHPAASNQDGWGLSFGRELNATDDRRHFSSSGTGGIPVIEGKHIQPFQVDLSRPDAFIDAATAARLLTGRPFTRPRLTYRDVASSGNRLTLIAAVLPAGVVTTHTLFCLKTRLEEDAQLFLCAMFNSFVANYLVRLRVGTHVTVAIIERLALPRPPSDAPEFDRMVAIARDLSRGAADPEKSALHQALAARIYGLDRDEFSHVLASLPLVEASHRDAAMSAFIRTI